MSTPSPKHILDWFVKNKQGSVVIWQFPNIPLWGWILCTLLALVLKHGHIHTGLHALAQALLFTWAYLELRSGESIFRRTLGGLVLVDLIISFFAK